MRDGKKLTAEISCSHVMFSSRGLQSTVRLVYYDVKDWGRTNCLTALNDVIKMYGTGIKPDNFTIHIRKKIARTAATNTASENVISSAFEDDSSTLTTRLYARMKMTGHRVL